MAAKSKILIILYHNSLVVLHIEILLSGSISLLDRSVIINRNDSSGDWVSLTGLSRLVGLVRWSVSGRISSYNGTSLSDMLDRFSVQNSTWSGLNIIGVVNSRMNRIVVFFDNNFFGVFSWPQKRLVFVILDFQVGDSLVQNGNFLLEVIVIRMVDSSSVFDSAMFADL